MSPLCSLHQACSIYFEDLGIQLGAELDSDLVNIGINGDQLMALEAAVLMGVTTLVLFIIQILLELG